MWHNKTSQCNIKQTKHGVSNELLMLPGHLVWKGGFLFLSTMQVFCVSILFFCVHVLILRLIYLPHVNSSRERCKHRSQVSNCTRMFEHIVACELVCIWTSVWNKWVDICEGEAGQPLSLWRWTWAVRCLELCREARRLGQAACSAVWMPVWNFLQRFSVGKVWILPGPGRFTRTQNRSQNERFAVILVMLIPGPQLLQDCIEL